MPYDVNSAPSMQNEMNLHLSDTNALTHPHQYKRVVKGNAFKSLPEELGFFLNKKILITLCKLLFSFQSDLVFAYE